MTNPAHTLASEEGLARFILILNAQEAWRTMTKIQRQVVAAQTTAGASPRTVAALERKGLVNDGTLTPWGEFVRLMNKPNGDPNE